MLLLPLSRALFQEIGKTCSYLLPCSFWPSARNPVPIQDADMNEDARGVFRGALALGSPRVRIERPSLGRRREFQQRFRGVRSDPQLVVHRVIGVQPVTGWSSGRDEADGWDVFVLQHLSASRSECQLAHVDA